MIVLDIGLLLVCYLLLFCLHFVFVLQWRDPFSLIYNKENISLSLVANQSASYQLSMAMFIDYFIQAVLTALVGAAMYALHWHWFRRFSTHLQHSGDQGREPVSVAVPEPVLLGVPRIDKQLIDDYCLKRGLQLEQADSELLYNRLLIK